MDVIGDVIHQLQVGPGNEDDVLHIDVRKGIPTQWEHFRDIVLLQEGVFSNWEMKNCHKWR